MILSILSDIHGNLEAFSKVMEQIRSVRPDRIISLGDNIGYGPDSEQIMTLLEKYRIKSILGNHEMAIRNPEVATWFNTTARKALEITKKQLSERSVHTIAGYPHYLVQEDIRFVHGAPPCSVFLYIFQLTNSNLMKKLDQIKERICFVGHTHDLGVIEYDGRKLKLKPLKQGRTLLEKDKKYIVNVGSVGQPRDDNPDAKVVFFDTRQNLLEVKYLAYDAKLTQKKIIRAGIPGIYANKLGRALKA